MKTTSTALSFVALGLLLFACSSSTATGGDAGDNSGSSSGNASGSSSGSSGGSSGGSGGSDSGSGWADGGSSSSSGSSSGAEAGTSSGSAEGGGGDATVEGGGGPLDATLSLPDGACPSDSGALLVDAGDACPAYEACVKSTMAGSCASKWQACYGADYESGDYTGGSCAAYMTCVRGCGCDATCLQGCSADSVCSSCVTDAEVCSRTACLDPYNSCINGAVDAGHPCSDLAGCCAALPDGQRRTTCNQEVTLGVDALCNAYWSSLGCSEIDSGAAGAGDAAAATDATDASDAGSAVDAGGSPDASEGQSPDAGEGHEDDASAPLDAGGDH